MKFGALSLKVMFHFIGKMDKKRYANLPSPEPYRPHFDADALGDGIFSHQIDVFHAKESNRNGRLILDIHGGAHIYGDRKNNIAFSMAFLEKGFDVITMDYDKNDGKRDVVGQVQTLGKQLRYIVDHAEELGVDASKMVLTGDSAGGLLSLILAEACDDPACAEALGIEVHGASFKSVAVSCPFYDFVRGTQSKTMTKSAKKLMFGPRYNDPEYENLLSPKEHLASLKTPLLVSSCRHDFLRQESLDLKTDAENLGKKIEFVYIDEEDKNVDHVHNVTKPNLVPSIAVNGAVASFFNDSFRE